MNATLVFALLRQRLTSPVRLLLVLAWFCLTLVTAAVMPMARFGPDDLVFVLILGAGMVGQDVSSGVLAGIFARPVRRAEYVTSRWLGVALGASALVLVECVLGFGVLALRGAGPGLGAMAAQTLGSIFRVFGLSAVLLFLSCCVNGLGDLALYAVAGLLFASLRSIGSHKSWSELERAGAEMLGFLGPRLDPGHLFGPEFSAFAVASYLSTITLCLALAIVLVNRKELSYAAG